MKNSKRFLAIIILAIVATTVAFVSCKKEQAPTAQQHNKSTLARIMDFKRQLNEVELNPNNRTITYMSIPDAIWNLEALFNVTYAYPDESYGQTICCDTTLYLPVCSNDSVSFVDLAVFNGQMYEAVLALYQAAVLENKQFLILDVEDRGRIGNQQVIELNTVQGSLKGGQPQPDPPQMWEPFAEGILWYYGENHANSMGIPVDAADTLTGMLNAILVNKAPEGSEYYYTNVMTKHTQLGENVPNPYPGYPDVTPRYCEFYKENPTAQDYWLNSDQMNYHYFGERHLVKNILPNDATLPVPSDHKLFHIIVEDQKRIESSVLLIGHHTTAFYGLQFMVSQDSIGKEIFQ